MTIESTDIIKEMLRNDGVYPGDPQVSYIYAYRNQMSNNLLFAVFMRGGDVDIFTSPYVAASRLLWQKVTGLTSHGKKFLETGKVEFSL